MSFDVNEGDESPTRFRFRAFQEAAYSDSDVDTTMQCRPPHLDRLLSTIKIRLHSMDCHLLFHFRLEERGVTRTGIRNAEGARSREQEARGNQ
jgi:hypothetical protein